MIKKIKVAELQTGMFVHDFNCGWLRHPFLLNKMKLTTQGEIEKILAAGIRELYIDTSAGLDVGEIPREEPVVPEEAVTPKVEPEAAAVSRPVRKAKRRTPLAEELTRAEALVAETKNTARHLMENVRLGKQIDVQEAEATVEMISQSVRSNKDALTSLLRIKNKDEYTYLHSLSVSALCISFGDRLGLDYNQSRQLGVGALLHDIGKVKLPGGLLNKPGPLSEEEYETIKTHARKGCAILQRTPNIDEVSLAVAAHHHERLDGTGYPDGIGGNRISLVGQIAAIADTYDDLTSDTSYKAATPPTEALKKIYQLSSNGLNRQLVEQFIAHLGIYPIGTVVRLRSNVIGVVIQHGEKGLLYPVVRVVYDVKKERAIHPVDIDLSKKVGTLRSDEIVACEAPEHYKIDPLRYLP